MSRLMSSAKFVHVACSLITASARSSTSIGARPIILTGSRDFASKDSRKRQQNFKKFRKFSKGESDSSDMQKKHVYEEPEITYLSQELLPSRAMLERIIEELKKNSGKEVILPTNENLLEEMLDVIRFLINKGVTPQFIISACSKSVTLLKAFTTRGDSVIEILDMLISECQFTYEDAIRVCYSCDEYLLKLEPSNVRERLDAIIACGVSPGRALNRVVKVCPPVIYATDPLTMKKLVESLSGFFSRKELQAVLTQTPEIFMKSIEELEEKYEYIFYQMFIESSEFAKCIKWAVLDLSEIILRHEFLLKCGKYIGPDAKRPQTKIENPDLSRILDSNDHVFATQVAGVTVEEWIIYQTFCEKQSVNSEKERPYERVKPSMRKAYERRHKDAQELPDHVFDVASRSE
ncbi:unnamed protein product [Auanema sp. JU1783]|nr:unnamed protein product [Auanema sp. JU1783]